MNFITRTPLSQVHRNVGIEDIEQDIIDIEIENKRQEQSITDHDIAILKLQKASSKTKEDTTNGSN